MIIQISDLVSCFLSAANGNEQVLPTDQYYLCITIGKQIQYSSVPCTADESSAMNANFIRSSTLSHTNTDKSTF